jgi:hypothetical protein
MSCPHLKEVVMLFCDACPVRKMLPLDRIVTADPCLGGYQRCPLYQELTARLAARDAATDVRAVASGRKEGPR